MKIIEVNNSATVKDFHKVPFIIYKDDPYWIPHIRQQVEMVFDKARNTFFSHGSAIRWILKDDHGNLAGRVAAFVNEKMAYAYLQPTGGMGFFECVANESYAIALFDTCKKWLQDKGMEAMDGPINFGENDKFWGLITKNFSLSPYYCQNYNPEYYKPFFENYGFQIYFNQIIYFRKISEPLQKGYVRRAERIARNPKFSVRSFEKKKKAKYVADFREVYNRAWQSHYNFQPMSEAQANALMANIKPILDEDLLWYVYYEERPVGFYISLPEINEIMKHMHGNFNWWSKIVFLWCKLWKTCKTSYGVTFGIDPDFHGRGIEGAIFHACLERMRQSHYENVIVTWIGDFNPKMMRVIEGFAATKIREMATYRKLFDENAVFERAPIIE